MKGYPFEIGRVAISKQGHDKGRWFAVVSVLDEKYVMIADGQTRPLEKPKKKQTKHLQWKPYLVGAITQGIRQGMPLQNSDLRKAINVFMALKPDPTQATGEVGSRQKEECALVQE